MMTASTTSLELPSSRGLDDIGTNFFSKWLDSTLIFSHGIWHSGDDLEQAQMRKLEYHVREAGIGAGDSVLDIGCGWGYLLGLLRTRLHVNRAIGITVHPTQKSWIDRTYNEGVEVYLQSWQNHETTQPYDAVFCIEAFEYFSKFAHSKPERLRIYREFFETVSSLLRKRGRLTLQTLAYERFPPNRQLTSDLEFILEHLFCSTELPHLCEILNGCKGLLRVVAMKSDQEDCKQTAKQWAMRLRQSGADVCDMVGACAYETYDHVFASLQRLAESGVIGVRRITFEREDVIEEWC